MAVWERRRLQFYLMCDDCNSGVIQVEPGGNLPISDDEDVPHPRGVSLHWAEWITELLVVLKSAGWNIFILFWLGGVNWAGFYRKVSKDNIAFLKTHKKKIGRAVPGRWRRYPKTGSQGWRLTRSHPASGSFWPAEPDQQNPVGFSGVVERCWPPSTTPTVG